MATNPNATNSQWTAHDAPALVATVPHELTGVETVVKGLEGKAEGELRNLYADWQREESDAKQDLYMLRQRISSFGTDIQTNEEILLASAKQRVASAMVYLKGLEAKISGTVTAPVPTVVTEPVPVDTVEPAQEVPVDTTPAA